MVFLALNFFNSFLSILFVIDGREFFFKANFNREMYLKVISFISKSDRNKKLKVYKRTNNMKLMICFFTLGLKYNNKNSFRFNLLFDKISKICTKCILCSTILYERVLISKVICYMYSNIKNLFVCHKALIPTLNTSFLTTNNLCEFPTRT